MEMAQGMNCHDCRHLTVEHGGNGMIFYRCQASGRVIEAVSEKAYWGTVVLPPAWCKGSQQAQVEVERQAAHWPKMLRKVAPSWKLDVLWDAVEVAAAYG